MISAELRSEVEAWIADDPDPVTAALLQSYLDKSDGASLTPLFNGFLQFGTAGLRGPIGAGPSCMNRAVVGRTAAGLARYMSKRGMKKVVIGRDARYGSEDYTFESAEILSGAGMDVYILPRPLPTPVLAFTTAELQCDLGIMVTASHNPPQDNGYKVYIGPDADGIKYASSQIINPTDGLIADEIAAITSLKSLPRGSKWTVLGEEVITEYINRTIKIAPRPGDLKIVYTAMHGVGTDTVQRVFNHAGFATLILVDEQCTPNPDFPTVAFPNPEEPGAIDLALAKARDFGADLVIANDPDADRCAAAVNDPQIGWRMLRGDELGVIFGEWIARTHPEGIFGNSIVSSSALRLAPRLPSPASPPVPAAVAAAGVTAAAARAHRGGAGARSFGRRGQAAAARARPSNERAATGVAPRRRVAAAAQGRRRRRRRQGTAERVDQPALRLL